MKIFLYSLMILTAINCGSTSQKEGHQQPLSVINPPAERQEEKVLVGSIQRGDLEQAPYKTWFDPMYQSFQPAENDLNLIKKNINDYEIKLFMGTWCADSQREVPKFLKLLDLSGFEMNRLEIKAVEEDKTLPHGGQEEYNVVYVPTIIFLKDGKEVNRFVEYPQKSFQEDIADIVSGEDYKNSYE
jgi:thiol-disulfide isomerase/thioredoxin